MKITADFPGSNGAEKATKQPDPANFAPWLETPGKQNSGDEYYWLHQSQLQQSCLHFDGQVIMKKEQMPEQQKNMNDNFNSSNELKQRDLPLLHDPINYQTQKIDSINLHAKQSASIIKAVQQALDKDPIAIATYNSKYTIEQKEPAKTIKIQHDTTNTKRLFKNHHLFIAEEQAELTLNTHQLNQDDQKKLKQMIQHYLKNNGFSLKSLIINGVIND